MQPNIMSTLVESVAWAIALAAIWWTWADATGYTKRKAMEADDKRRDERRMRTKEALDANFQKTRRR